MLGLLLIYYIGKQYYNLAGYHDKSKWSFAVLGVGSYYGGAFLGGIIIGLVLRLSSGSVDDMSPLALNLIALPLGAGATFLLYHLLKKNWEKQKRADSDMIEQIGSAYPTP